LSTDVKSYYASIDRLMLPDQWALHVRTAPIPPNIGAALAELGAWEKRNRQKLVVLVGQKKAVAIAVRNVSGRRRWSKLNEWLRGK